MRVLIADDHRLIIEGVKLKLRELGDLLEPGTKTEIEFVEAETVAQLRAQLERLPLPDLALIDMAMPGANGIDHIREVVEKLADANDEVTLQDSDSRDLTDEERRQASDLIGTRTARKRSVIVLSGTEDSAAIRQVLDLGVQGYILKSSSPAVILNAVQLVIGGGIYVPPEAMKAAASTTVPFFPTSNGNDGLSTKERLATVLTERQIDVLKLLAKGRPNKLIARELGISEGTVKIHLAAIFRALHVRNRLEALVAAQHLGD
jgi:DNA-binding NarL/FixJ family response regulator